MLTWRWTEGDDDGACKKGARDGDDDGDDDDEADDGNDNEGDENYNDGNDNDDDNDDDDDDDGGQEDACAGNEGAICTRSSLAGDGWNIMLDPTINQNAFQMGPIAKDPAYKGRDQKTCRDKWYGHWLIHATVFCLLLDKTFLISRLSGKKRLRGKNVHARGSGAWQRKPVTWNLHSNVYAQK